MDAKRSRILRDFAVRHHIDTEFALNILSACGWNPVQATVYLDDLHCNPNPVSQSAMSSVTASAMHRQHQQQQPKCRNIPIQVEGRASNRGRDLDAPLQPYSPVHVQQTQQRPVQRAQRIHVSQDASGIQGGSRGASRPATSYVNDDHTASTTAYSWPFSQPSTAERYATGRDGSRGQNMHVSSVHINNDQTSDLYNGHPIRPSVIRQAQLSGNSVLNSQERTVPIPYNNDGQETSWKTYSRSRSTGPIITAAEKEHHFNVTTIYPPSNVLQSHNASSTSSYPFYVEQSSSSPIAQGYSTVDSQYSQPVTLSGGSRVEDARLPMVPLQQSEAIDEMLIADDGGRTLKRGISKTSDNFLLVTQEKDKVLHDIHESPDDQLVETAELTFTLPDLDQFIGDLHCFLEKELIEMSTLVSLQQAGCLNWWYDAGVCQKLWPMATTGDGNCLLHAASLAMWGFHDRNLILRKALFESMTAGTYKSALFRRWRYQQTFVNKQSGLIYSEDEWHIEWDNLLRLASAQPRRTQCDTIKQSSCCDSPLTHGCKESSPDSVDNIVYESLEEFHVFVLAHVLRRPVIVVADKVLRDTNGEALAPIPFGGIFLPLECRPDLCHHSPLLLTYDAAHFSALVPMEVEKSGPLLERSNSTLQAAIPLVDCQLSLLTLHFTIDPGERFNWSSLDEESAEACSGVTQLSTISCELLHHEKVNVLQKYMDFQYIGVSSKLVDEMCESDGERKSSGSMDSDESAASFSGNSKDRQRKDSGGNSRMQQQMQSVAKGFGSIGKSVSKRLKALGKGGLGKVDKKCVGSIVAGSVVASGVVVCKGDEKSSIPCAKLSTKRSLVQDQLVMNYIADAKKRFEKELELKQKKALHAAQQKAATLPRPRAPPPPYSSINESLSITTRVQCVQPNCTMFGTSETSYLCSDCYSRSKREEEHLRGTGNSNALPDMTRTSQYTEDFVHKEGKSKFYVPQTPVIVSQTANVNIIPITVMNDEKPERKRTYHPHSNINPNHASMAVGSSSTLPTMRVNIAPAKPNVHTAPTSMIQDDARKRVLQNVTNKVALDRSSAPVVMGFAKEPSRSPSPYDNINKVESRQLCKNDDCHYYGSKETDNYCSQCYKSMHKLLEDDPTCNIAKTRL